MTNFKILILVSLISIAKCWDLSDLGLGQNYYISDIAVYLNRAFLAIPRTVCPNNVSYPTLVEISWKEFNNPIMKLMRYSKTIADQEWGLCEELQDVVALALESKKPRLWILDKGNLVCPVKIAMFNLFQNSLTSSVNLDGVPGDNLNSIVIDPRGERAYVGNIGEGKLLVLSLNNLKWWKISLAERHNSLATINADFLAVSKTKNILYITSKETTEVFSMKLDEVENTALGVTLEGNKLGKSTGIETDIKGGLIYYLVRDYAIVRWIIGKPFVAENHNVLAQSYDRLPYVSRIFTDFQQGIWALVNPVNPEQCTKVDIDNNSVPLDRRTVKIMKYNTYLGLL